MASVANRLSELYWELQAANEAVGLEEFTERAAAGEYDEVTREELRAFLHAVEERLVRQVERRETGAHDAVTAEELVDETRAWIADLTAKFCEGR
jgi:hypothetical protein